MHTMRFAEAALAASLDRMVALEVTRRAMNTAKLVMNIKAKILLYVEACLSDMY